jgi:hypothetical protein
MSERKTAASGRRPAPSAPKTTSPSGSPLKGPLTPASVTTLQRVAGNAATGRLLQRHGGKKPALDESAVSRDYTNAMKYVDDFYQGVDRSLELKDKVRERAQSNYENIGQLQDPPTLGDEIVKAIFSVALSKLPGGELIAKGLEIGLFASELGKLKLELDEQPIPGYGVEDEERAGPSEATKERAKKLSEHAKTGWETASKVYDTVVDVLAKQKAAAEAEAKALESAGLSRRRIEDWAAATEAAQKEEAAVTEWVKQAGADKKLRGGMEAAVRRRLGPIPVVTKAQVDVLTMRYELELYRAKFGGEHGAGKDVRTIYTGPWDDFEVPGSELRVAGGLSQATRRRIATCAGVTATDDRTMVKVLGIRTVVERKRNPGLKRPGEM